MTNKIPSKTLTCFFTYGKTGTKLVNENFQNDFLLTNHDVRFKIKRNISLSMIPTCTKTYHNIELHSYVACINI